MSVLPERTNITIEQLVSMPDEGRRRELVKGVLRVMSPAGGRHGVVTLRLGRHLGAHVDAHELGYVFAAETGFVLSRHPDTVRAPDVAFVRRERLPRIADVTGFVPVIPDLVAEVVSPTDTFSSVEEKTQCWLGSGVHVVLIVDAANHTVRICRGANTIEVLGETDELTLPDVLPGWRVKIAELFD